MSPIVLPPVVESLGAGSVLKAVQGTGKSAPSGVDAIIAFRDLVMNNRKWFDGIIITKIDGLSDASIRDERQNNPQDHGETAFDSFYGGRSLALNGYIRSYTLDKLRDIEQGLKAAFLPLEENPLQIQGKTFDSSVQIWCRKNAEMVWAEEQTRDDMFIRSFMIPLRASNPRFVSLGEALRMEEFGVVDTFASDTIGSNGYYFLSGNGTLVVKEGKLTPTSTATKILSRQLPEVFHPQPSAQFDYTPKGSFTSSHVGFYVKYLDANNNIFIDITEGGAISMSVKVEGVSNGRAFTYTLGASPVARSLGTTYRVKAELRGNVVWLYHGTTTEWKQIAKYELTFTEREKLGSSIYSREYLSITPGSTEWSYDNLVFGLAAISDEQIMTVVNNGIFEAEPVYELIGPITSPIVHNADTDESLIFKSGTEVPAGDIWSIDIKEGTLTNLAGESKFGRLDPTSDWPQLIGGENHLRLSGELMTPLVSGISGILPGLVVRYRHSWF